MASFTILEDFLRERIREVLLKIASGPRSFDELPEKLQEACTVGASNAILKKYRRPSFSRAEKIMFVQKGARLIASTLEPTYEISDCSLLANTSNVSAAELSKALNTLGVFDPWKHIERLCKRVGVGVPSIKALYTAALHRRHVAAHVPASNVNLPELEAFSYTAIAIAIAVDCLLLQSRDRLTLASTDELKPPFACASSCLLRFLDQQPDKKWKEKIESGKRSTRVYATEEDALNTAVARAKRRTEILIVRDASKRPMHWHA